VGRTGCFKKAGGCGSSNVSTGRFIQAGQASAVVPDEMCPPAERAGSVDVGQSHYGSEP
jgi:hypothetical protein